MFRIARLKLSSPLVAAAVLAACAIDRPTAPSRFPAATDVSAENVDAASAQNQKRGSITITLVMRPDHPGA